MEKQQHQIELQLFIIIGNKYSGPINFGTWLHQYPSQITNKSFVSIIGFKNELSNDTILHLYHLGKRRFLDNENTFEKQEVGPMDIVAITNNEDTELLETLLISLVKMNQDKKKLAQQSDPSKFNEILEDY